MIGGFVGKAIGEPISSTGTVFTQAIVANVSLAATVVRSTGKGVIANMQLAMSLGPNSIAKTVTAMASVLGSILALVRLNSRPLLRGIGIARGYWRGRN
jgi:hypothetical protein